MSIKWDGHTHTRFCYHGSSAPQEEYLDQAVKLGFERYTISEHPPLPQGWIGNAALFEELAMPEAELPLYFAYVKQMQEQYSGSIEITSGLELDYLPGRLDYTERLFGPLADGAGGCRLLRSLFARQGRHAVY
ncbi:PHP domain-containing protein [Paenibacillus sp. TAB 01]|uniref:PHP domain-containing protein n=1 Tax=Paenibacillus sp. TAB 01 TaxID=3368988 RepID=UPI0037511F0C